MRGVARDDVLVYAINGNNSSLWHDVCRVARQRAQHAAQTNGGVNSSKLPCITAAILLSSSLSRACNKHCCVTRWRLWRSVAAADRTDNKTRAGGYPLFIWIWLIGRFPLDGDIDGMGDIALGLPPTCLPACTCTYRT